jgi:organic radical activating enzyme
MNKIIRVQQPDNAPLNLTWIINNICTNHCSYCAANLHTGKNHNYEWANALRFFEMLFERYPKIHCSVSGGEPSVSPFFPEICKLFYERGHTIGVTTNLAKPVRYWKELAPYLNYASISWHSQFVDINFLEKTLAVAELIPTNVRVLMLPGQWEQCVAAYNKLSNIDKFTTEPVRIQDKRGMDTSAHVYNVPQQIWFEKNRPENKDKMRHLTIDNNIGIGATYYFNDDSSITNPNITDLVNNGLTYFKGYTCEIGLKSLYIDYNGTVFAGNCCVGGPLGSINDPTHINWPTTPIKCNVNLCHCDTDVMINKWID